MNIHCVQSFGRLVWSPQPSFHQFFVAMQDATHVSNTVSFGPLEWEVTHPQPNSEFPTSVIFLIVLNPPGINTHPKTHPSGASIPADHVLSDHFPVEFSPSAAICFSETETVMFLMFLLNSYNYWMEEILHQLIGGLSYYFKRFQPSKVVQDFATIHRIIYYHMVGQRPY